MPLLPACRVCWSRRLREGWWEPPPSADASSCSSAAARSPSSSRRLAGARHGDSPAIAALDPAAAASGSGSRCSFGDFERRAPRGVAPDLAGGPRSSTSSRSTSPSTWAAARRASGFHEPLQLPRGPVPRRRRRREGRPPRRQVPARVRPARDRRERVLAHGDQGAAGGAEAPTSGRSRAWPRGASSTCSRSATGRAAASASA